VTSEPVRLHLRSPAQTEALAAQLAELAGPGDLLLLTGGIGAGKTVFARGFARALGVTEPVTSPTFVLHSIYDSGRLAMNHFDLYRLEAQAEVDELAIWEFMDGAVTLVEWADRSGGFEAPFLTLAFELAPAETERWVTITAAGESWRERLERLSFAPATP
jgi:tRNA threonylcarbamoyladenosine biosynthesis protein TsaE